MYRKTDRMIADIQNFCQNVACIIIRREYEIFNNGRRMLVLYLVKLSWKLNMKLKPFRHLEIEKNSLSVILERIKFCQIAKEWGLVR